MELPRFKGVRRLINAYIVVLAVFVAALALRATEHNHEYHQKLHDFAEELERLLMMVLLVIFGGTITDGQLFQALTWETIGFAFLTIFTVRPLAGWIGMIGTARAPGETMATSFFGIRGIGSIYYLAYALQKESFDNVHLLWSTTGFIILVSIVLHGITVTPVRRRLDRRRKLTALASG